MARLGHACSAIAMALIATAVAGCAKKVPQPRATAPPSSTSPNTATTSSPSVPAPPRPAAPPAPVPSAPARPTDTEIFARKTVDELNADRVLSDAFFDVDRSDIREDAKAPLQRDADWLRQFPSTKVIVEGYCDSRGSSEYN